MGNMQLSSWLVMLLVFVSTLCRAAEEVPQRKPLSAIDIDRFTSELQVVVSDNTSMTQAWWIPAEFWGTAFSRTNPALAEQAMSQLADYGILAIVQADITPLAGFVFYDRSNVKQRLSVKFKSYKQNPLELSHSEKLSDSVQMLLDVLGPMFANTMGELGKNMHLYVVDNRINGNTLVDPYTQGQVEIKLAKTKTAEEKYLTIELPVDALYEPRYCPNGKPAHISWKYCPWSGKAL
ncbi:MAG: hypothetical protein MI867_26120 [Pseudomonadales bacterium]|nr:hypothetical protein [Pseudomonadales bacterium]